MKADDKLGFWSLITHHLADNDDPVVVGTDSLTQGGGSSC